LSVIAALALIGGLAAITFSKVFGIAFLGEPRSSEAARAHSPSLVMSGPLFVLAGGCVVLGLFAPSLGPILPPVLAPVLHTDAATLATDLDRALAPLVSVILVAALLIGLVMALALVRWLLLKGRSVNTSETWGCGYAGPTPRMQYTSSSFVQPALDFFAPLLQPRQTITPPEGLFPRSGTFNTQAPDLSREYFYRPVFEYTSRLLSRLRWLQHGNVHLYVLYVGLTLLALLLWFVSVKPG
jgi:hydrogenase-4 component B